MFMLLIVAFTTLPLIYVISTSLKPLDEIFIFPPRFFVQKPTLTNYSSLFRVLSGSDVPFLRYIFNSILTTVATVFFTATVSCMGAFALVKHKVLFGKFMFSLIIAALMFAPQVTQTSTYMVVNSMGLVNNYLALIIPKVAMAYNIFLMKQFMEQMPDALLEAARIDGANELKIFLKIIVPSVKPAIATLVVLSFVQNWNDFYTPLLYTTSQTMKTLPLAIQTIGQNGALARAGAMSAATAVMIIPTILLFVFMQKHVIQTMVYSGIKS